jgi:glycosyltransferase involved in cell wall biosynthesis
MSDRSRVDPRPQVSNRTRVLHLLESDGVYGAENVVLNLSREMARDGVFEPVVGCLVRSPEEAKGILDRAKEHGLPVLPVLFRNRVFLYDLFATPSRLRRAGVKLIHAHNHKATILAFVTRTLAGIPILATCHLLFVGESSPVTYRMLVRLEQMLFHRFSRIVTVSQAISDRLASLGIPAGNTRVISNGIFVSDYDKPRPEVIRARKQALGLREGSRIILNLARLTEQKAQRDLIIAAKSILDQGRDVQLLLVGDGELRSPLDRLIRESGLEGRVLLLGFRSDSREILQIADIFALPSLEEGLPMSLLEAMAAELPIVVSTVGAMPDVVRDRREGLLVPPGDTAQLTAALLDLLDNPPLAAELAAGARQRVEALFSSQKMYEQYRAVYEDVLGGRQPGIR